MKTKFRAHLALAKLIKYKTNEVQESKLILLNLMVRSAKARTRNQASLYLDRVF